MSKLLPSNATLKDQAFARLIEEAGRTHYDELDTDPQSCHSSLLAHIAAGYNVSIDGMTEEESRTYLSKAESLSRIRGTAQAVEDVLGVTFQDARLVEWWEAEDLEPGDFRVAVTIKADPTVRYDERKFALSRRLIGRAKNVRSHLADFEVSLPQSVTDINLAGGMVMDARLAQELEIGWDAPVSFTGGLNVDARLSAAPIALHSATQFVVGGNITWTF